MIPIKVPDWWDSIRAILALSLSLSYCYGILHLHIPRAELAGLEKLTELVIVFYFVLKKRTEENGTNLPK